MVTREQVLGALATEEPNYVQAAVLGPEALRHLAQIVGEEDEHLSPRAAFFAGLIGTERAVPVIELGLRSDPQPLRLAAARATGRIDPIHRGPLLELALQDPDPDVVSAALDAVTDHARRDVLGHVMRLAGRPDVPARVRGLAERTLARQRGPAVDPVQGSAASRVGERARRLRGRLRRKRRSE